MYTDIKVEEGVVTVHAHSGWGAGSHVKLGGSTCSIVPIGTVVDKLSLRIPDGLHAVAFLCRVEEPQKKGSGRTAYLDYTLKLSSNVLLCWRDGKKLIVKDDSRMTAPELAKFNPFVRSDADIFVVNAEAKTVYISSLEIRGSSDPEWTYKLVSMNDILKYITKELTLEELDQRAASGQKARDELQELQDGLSEANKTIIRLSASYVRIERQRCRFSRDLEGEVVARQKIERALAKSRFLYDLLKRIPAKLRPRAFDGFIAAMELLNRG